MDFAGAGQTKTAMILSESSSKGYGTKERIINEDKRVVYYTPAL